MTLKYCSARENVICIHFEIIMSTKDDGDAGDDEDDDNNGREGSRNVTGTLARRTCMVIASKLDGMTPAWLLVKLVFL